MTSWLARLEATDEPFRNVNLDSHTDNCAHSDPNSYDSFGSSLAVQATTRTFHQSGSRPGRQSPEFPRQLQTAMHPRKLPRIQPELLRRSYEPFHSSPCRSGDGEPEDTHASAGRSISGILVLRCPVASVKKPEPLTKVLAGALG